MKSRTITVAAAAAALGAPASADVVSHWTFDEPGGVTAADRVGARHGTLVGGAAFAPGQGVSGGAVRLARSPAGHVSMGQVLPMTGGVDFSISVWVRLAAGEARHQYLVARHEAFSFNGYLLAVNPDPGGYGRAGKAWFYTSNPPQAEPRSSTDVNDGAWHHVVAVYDAGVASRLYVDGGPPEDTRSPHGVAANSAVFMLGGIQRFGAPVTELDGLLDDLQVYDTALDDAAVQYLFDHPGLTLGDCYADCDTSTGRGVLDIFDFLCFQNRFDAGDPYACDCDTSTGGGVCDIFDFLCFQNAFDAGCP